MTYSSKTTCPDRVLPSTLHTSHCTLHSSHSKLQTSHSTLHTSHSTLLTSHCFLHTPNLTLHTSHCALCTPNLNFTLHTAHFTLHTSHFSLPTASFTLHTALFTPHTSHCSKPTWNKKTLMRQNGENLLTSSLWQPSCSHSNTIYEVELQKTIVLRMQPQHEATLTQPLQCDLQRLWETELQNTIELRATASDSKTGGSRRQSEKKTILKHFLKEKENHCAGENLLTNHCRSLHAATPIRFTRSSCKRQ